MSEPTKAGIITKLIGTPYFSVSAIERMNMSEPLS